MFKKIICLFLMGISLVCDASEKSEHEVRYILACPKGCTDEHAVEYKIKAMRDQIEHNAYEKAHSFSVGNPHRFSPSDADLYFATQFLKTSFEKNKDNFVISPLSVYAATVLLANGANGASRSELGHILGVKNWETKTFPFDLDDTNKFLRAYMAEKKQFEINNSIWGNELKSEYVEKMEKELISVAKPLPKNTSSINEWVKEKTKERIQNLLGNRTTEKHELFLVNTVYFKDEWKTYFDEYGTRVAQFYSLDGQVDKVDMMSMSGVKFLDYYEDDKMQAVSLPYKNGDVMQIFLPKKGVNFNDFVRSLSANDLYLAYYKVPVKLKLPRFNLEYKENQMSDFFKQWGIESVLDKEKADLSGLSYFPHYVAGIIHQATIDVNEKGTEATAVTAMFLDGASVNMKLSPQEWFIPFIADRPFVFMINNGDFIGVYTKGASTLYQEQLKRKKEDNVRKIEIGQKKYFVGTDGTIQEGEPLPEVVINLNEETKDEK